MEKLATLGTSVGLPPGVEQSFEPCQVCLDHLAVPFEGEDQSDVDRDPGPIVASIASSRGSAAGILSTGPGGRRACAGAQGFCDRGFAVIGQSRVDLQRHLPVEMVRVLPRRHNRSHAAPTSWRARARKTSRRRSCAPARGVLVRRFRLRSPFENRRFDVNPHDGILAHQPGDRPVLQRLAGQEVNHTLWPASDTCWSGDATSRPSRSTSESAWRARKLRFRIPHASGGKRDEDADGGRGVLDVGARVMGRTA
jgi:hypothetical protein